MRYSSRNWRRRLSIAALTLLASCSGGHRDAGSKLAGESTFDAAPRDQESLEGQLKRFKGQTKFLTPSEGYWARGGVPAAADAKAEAGSERAVQESDVFKVGKSGSKLLYLLNNYRGLQVVSFADGAEKPKLLGRVAPTGNWPQDMYFDQAHDRLVVLENNYQSNDGDYYEYSELQSRVVVYDVADASKPKIASVIDLHGTLSESRLVGDILYVATSVRPDWSSRQAGQNAKGFVTSLTLAAQDVKSVETLALAAPVSYAENMNVVEEKVGDAYKYYLVAILAKDGWGFWERQSLVQVVDISSPEGKIAPVMVVNAKGSVRERSQTTVKNSTLIVTSNYTAASDTRSLARIAVETFTFPNAESETLSAEEAQFRKLYVERELKKKETVLRGQGVAGDELQDQLDKAREGLLADKDLGLKGRFVQQASDNGRTSLEKPFADSVATVGNTQGLSASLQDVRYQGNLLYAFWVPANNIDPLDVFDLSEPQKGVKHLTHLEFDGWVQRAIPVSYNGKNYILGLGWVVPPPVDNEHLRRYPQAVLFELKTYASGSVRANLVAQKSLGNSNTWANFNGQDKEIEARFTDDGSGTILFTFDGWSESSYLQGGKVIGFDLKAAETDPDHVFSEGGVLAANSGWLRRVFNNPEIGRVNTFADEALGVYDLNAAFAAADGVIKATAILELARNIRAYETLGKGEALVGVQIVSSEHWYSSDPSSTELRVVQVVRADAEKGKNLVSLPGSYIDRVKLADGSLLVLTQQASSVRTASGFEYKSTYFVHTAVLTGDKLTLTGKVSWDAKNDDEALRLGWQQRLVLLANGEVLAATGNQLQQISMAAADLTATAVAVANCKLDGSETASLNVFEGKAYLTYEQQVKDPEHVNVTYRRIFFAPLTLAANALTCANAVNIPGTPVAVVDGKHLVTDDTRLVDLVKRGEGGQVYFQQITEKSLDSLALTAEAAKLADLHDPKNVASGSTKIVNGDTLVFVESSARPAYYFASSCFTCDFGPLHPSSSSDDRLTVLGFDSELAFTKRSFVLDLAGRTNATLQALVASPKTGEGYLALVSQGQKLSVLSFDLFNRPVQKNLQAVDADGNKLDPAATVRTTGYWYSDNGSTHFTPELLSFEIPEGLFGVQQVYVVD